MQAVALVAHPDDCVIFAWPFIEAHPEFDWTIVYLTYRDTEPRARELQAYWDQRGIPTVFLGYHDTWLDMVRGKISFDEDRAEQDLIAVGNASDLILTHNADGDYGHIHHKFVSAATEKMVPPKVYFASTFNYNTQYAVQTPVEPTELPLHRSVIEEFHNRNTGLYIVTPEADTLIKKNK